MLQEDPVVKLDVHIIFTRRSCNLSVINVELNTIFFSEV